MTSKLFLVLFSNSFHLNGNTVSPSTVARDLWPVEARSATPRDPFWSLCSQFVSKDDMHCFYDVHCFRLLRVLDLTYAKLLILLDFLVVVIHSVPFLGLFMPKKSMEGFLNNDCFL